MRVRPKPTAHKTAAQAHRHGAPESPKDTEQAAAAGEENARRALSQLGGAAILCDQPVLHLTTTIHAGNFFLLSTFHLRLTYTYQGVFINETLNIMLRNFIIHIFSEKTGTRKMPFTVFSSFFLFSLHVFDA